MVEQGGKKRVLLAASLMGETESASFGSWDLWSLLVFSQPLWSWENIYKPGSFALLSRNDS